MTPLQSKRYLIPLSHGPRYQNHTPLIKVNGELGLELFITTEVAAGNSGRLQVTLAFEYRARRHARGVVDTMYWWNTQAWVDTQRSATVVVTM